MMQSNTVPVSNIIAFPMQNRRAPAQSMEEVYESVTQTRIDHIDILLEIILEYISYKVTDEGFDIMSDECEKSYIMLHQALKSLMCQSVGIYHQLQTLADELDPSDGEE